MKRQIPLAESADQSDIKDKDGKYFEEKIDAKNYSILVVR
jgi:hypothetical protein